MASLQAVEAKEGLEIQNETVTLASISYQNFFRSFPKLAGMTGTAATEAEEFKTIYRLDVQVVPPNRPVRREDNTDVVMRGEEGKWNVRTRKDGCPRRLPLPLSPLLVVCLSLPPVPPCEKGWIPSPPPPPHLLLQLISPRRPPFSLALLIPLPYSSRPFLSSTSRFTAPVS